MSKRKVQSEKCKVKTQNLKFLVLSFSFAFCALSFAPNCFSADKANPSELFYKANAAYEKAKYDEAIAEYQKALDTGLESGNIYYNLGNAYFKKGEAGRAILNYKRAERFIPQDPDLKLNLALFGKSAPNVMKDLSVDELCVFLAILYLLMFLLAVIPLFAKGLYRHIKIPLIVCSAIFAVSLAAFFIKVNQISRPWAVILDKEVEARYEPFDSATVYFKLFQGQEALLLKINNEWAFIKRPDGKTGWIKASSIEKT